MSTTQQVEEITKGIVAEALEGVQTVEVHASEETDWQGEPSFSIIIVLPDNTFKRKDIGEKLLDISLSVRESLLRDGEDRFPYVNLSSISEATEAVFDQ